jgi:hypothetical protein
MIDKLRTIFWNTNGWKSGETIDKLAMIVEAARKEDAELICLTDTRLDGIEELRYLSNAISSLRKGTGKTWADKIISRKEDLRVGGALILYSAEWTQVNVREAIKYGCLTEFSAK